ncbi:MAG: DNA topoisomerase IV subunit A, partial [Sulfolobales archaeon]
MTSYTSKVDLEARKRISEILRKRFLEIAEKIERGEEPEMLIPKRTLSNTIYDPKRKLLLLGDEKFSRKFFDLNEARKFMQTTLMASIIYESLINNEYPTIRDLYYRGKHTIRYKIHEKRIEEENTWDEQKESDSVLRDIEVYTNLLREDMLILSKEKGKVVGNMRIKSGDDVIDLSKMGHGAYAIEPTPDLIDFIDVDAEYVLVVEKDAVFQQLHRAGFWKKYKAILITSAGQPDRATRRFVRRLNEELKLPVYIITDSDPYGWYIYSVFKIGSITLSYESERLATPNAIFLGVSMTDIFGDPSKGKKPYLTESE